MCLEVSRFRHPTMKPKKARRDIPCYKGLLMRFDGKLKTPWMETDVEKLDIERGLCADCFQTVPVKLDGCYVIERAVHTWKRPPKLVHARGILIRCYIPKGTLYWRGKKGEYASETIMFNHTDGRS